MESPLGLPHVCDDPIYVPYEPRRNFSLTSNRRTIAMTNADFQPIPSEIQLLAIECDRDSITRLSLGHYFQNGLSLLVYCYTTRELEPERVLLPGLFLLDDESEHSTRVNIR